MAKDMSEQILRKKKKLYLGSLALLLLACIAGLLYWKYQIYFPNPSTRHLEINGKVVDAQSGKAVPNARIVITITNEFGLTGLEQYFYGLVSEPNGLFGIKTKTPIDIDWTRVDACTEDGKTASAVTESNSIVLRLESPSKQLPPYKQLTAYKHFTGLYRPFSPTDMEFIGMSWEIRTPMEIETGEPSAIILPAKENETGK